MVKVSGVNGLCLTKIDVLDGLEKIKICTDYSSTQTKEAIIETMDIEDVDPFYLELDGWSEPTAGKTDYDDLNANAKAFVEKMNQELIEHLRIDTDDTERERLYLKRLLMDYINETESELAESILENFRAEIRNFWMVKPKNMTVLPLNPDEGD